MEFRDTDEDEAPATKASSGYRNVRSSGQASKSLDRRAADQRSKQAAGQKESQ